jgi:hypothetical protein
MKRCWVIVGIACMAFDADSNQQEIKLPKLSPVTHYGIEVSFAG